MSNPFNHDTVFITLGDSTTMCQLDSSFVVILKNAKETCQSKTFYCTAVKSDNKQNTCDNTWNGLGVTLPICATLILIAFLSAIYLIVINCTQKKSEMRKRKAETKKEYQKDLLGYLKEETKNYPLNDDDPYFGVLRQCINEEKITTEIKKKEKIEKNRPKMEAYQKMLLDYLKDKNGDCDVDKDAFVTTIKGYIKEIEASINEEKSNQSEIPEQ